MVEPLDKQQQFRNRLYIEETFDDIMDLVVYYRANFGEWHSSETVLLYWNDHNGEAYIGDIT